LPGLGLEQFGLFYYVPLVMVEAVRLAHRAHMIFVIQYGITTFTHFENAPILHDKIAHLFASHVFYLIQL